MPTTAQDYFSNNKGLGSSLFTGQLEVPATTISSLNASSWKPELSYKSSFTDYSNLPAVSESNRLQLGAINNAGTETPWYKDGQAMQGYAGLASSFAQLASLPGQLKLAKLQRQGLQQNINQQKTDNAFRANVRDNLRTHRIT